MLKSNFFRWLWTSGNGKTDLPYKRETKQTKSIEVVFKKTQSFIRMSDKSGRTVGSVLRTTCLKKASERERVAAE